MNTWARRIEEFSRPLHKGISVIIRNVAPEEIEMILDNIAKDADWAYKNVEVKNANKKLISYQTKEFENNKALMHPTRVAIRYLQYQIVEYILIFEKDSIRLNIESRYLAPENKLALLLFYLLGFPFASGPLYDTYGKNSENIQYILAGLQMHFKDRINILDKIQTKEWKETEMEQVSKLSVLLAFIKVLNFLVTIAILLFIFLPLLLSFLREVFFSFVSVLF